MKQYLDITTLAERLQIKRSTLYAWAEQGTLPYLRLGRLLRFDPDEIEAWLQDHRQECIPELTSHRRQNGTDSIDILIAQAKQEAYTRDRGKPDQDRATRKGELDGSV